jgi:uncharacterized protein
MKRIISSTMLICALGCANGALAAGALPDSPYVIATGKATTDVVPDYAVFSFSIEGLAPTTEAASAIVGQKATKVFAVLKAARVSNDDVRASSVNVTPSYDYAGDRRNYRGQDARRGFKVTLHDLKNFSSLLQGLLDANLDQIDDVEFGSSKEDQIEKSNLESAIDNARKQAEDMAGRAGEHVDKIYGMAPGQYSNFITQDFPYEYSGNGTSQLGKIEVTGTDIGAAKREQGYFIPKSITFTSTVTIVCTVK